MAHATTIELIEGEVLIYLEEHGTVTFRQLCRDLQWAPALTLLAVSVLIQQGLVRLTQQTSEILVEAVNAKGDMYALAESTAV